MPCSSSFTPNLFGAIIWLDNCHISFCCKFNPDHGSYGATPQVVLHAQQKWQHFMETNCCRFFGYQYSTFMAHAIRTMASFVGAQPEEVVFVDNATTGVVTVVQSLKLKPTDSILYLSIGYGPIANYLKTMDVERIVVDCKLPLEINKIADLVVDAVKPNTKVAVLDHITSSTGAILPLERIISRLQAKDVFVMIDGAHAVGQIPLNMTALNADAYVSNCHKWLYTSKGCAFLYINPKHANTIHPLVCSSGAGLGLSAEFGWSGTKDYSSYLSVMTAIELYNFWGPDRIRTYIHNWAVEAAEHIMTTWGTKTVFADDPENPNAWKQHVGAMVTIEIPTSEKNIATYDFALQIKRTMLLEKGIDCICYPIGDKLYCRVSGQIYLDKEDYIMFGEDLPRVLDSLILAQKASEAGFTGKSGSETKDAGPEEAH
jgi:isopenicillin-N epimerase